MVSQRRRATTHARSWSYPIERGLVQIFGCTIFTPTQEFARTGTNRTYQSHRLMGEELGEVSQRHCSKDMILNNYNCQNGGETGIRTLGTRKGSTVFETVPFDHSGTSPRYFQAHLGGIGRRSKTEICAMRCGGEMFDTVQ